VSPCDDGEREVEQREVVARLLGPADQDGAEAVQPRVRALHHPTPRPGSGAALGPDLLAARAQVQGEAELPGQGTRLVVVEALVEAEVLRAAARRPGPPDRDGLDGGAHQLVAVPVGAVDRRPDGDAAAVGQHRALDPALAAVRRVRAGFSPRRAGPCPSPRPAPATSNRCRGGRRRPAAPRARTPRTPRPRSTPGSAGGPRRTSRCPSPGARSTGTPSAARRRWRPSRSGPAPAGCGSPAGASAAVAAAAPSSPTARPAAASRHPGCAVSSASARSFLPCAADGDRGGWRLLGYAFGRGKCKMAALGAAMRKIVHLCFGVLK